MTTAATGVGQIDQTAFRTVLGHFCTGVAVITGRGPDGPVGFACQSFAALSLDPPLVLFCPTKASGTWPVIEAAGTFAVNVLAADQRDVSTVFGSRGADKFASLQWRPAASGAPLLDGVVTWIDCAVETVHDGGDHYVVVGRVLELGPSSPERPLLFYRGRYTGTAPERGEAIPADRPLDAFLPWPVGDDWV
ncbi:MAG: flavin reductase family protein [Mycobacteriaceae bacterium]|nr:flavin reductase family protein [Mycobacteriaceae bacterium]